MASIHMLGTNPSIVTHINSGGYVAESIEMELKCDSFRALSVLSKYAFVSLGQAIPVNFTRIDARLVMEMDEHVEEPIAGEVAFEPPWESETFGSSQGLIIFRAVLRRDYFERIRSDMLSKFSIQNIAIEMPDLEWGVDNWVTWTPNKTGVDNKEFEKASFSSMTIKFS